MLSYIYETLTCIFHKLKFDLSILVYNIPLISFIDLDAKKIHSSSPCFHSQRK